jgi:hypothetical protein
MTQEEANKLKHGVYVLYWTYAQKYPYSLGAIGNDIRGDNWFMPVNWGSTQCSKDWDAILRVELIEEMDYYYPPRLTFKLEDLTPTEAYKVQIYKNDLVVMTPKGKLFLDLPAMVKSLRECGYQITDPPHKSFLEIKEFLDNETAMPCIDAIGENIYKFREAVREETITIARGTGRTEVDINKAGRSVFIGHVLSLEEFKLIWDRVL